MVRCYRQSSANAQGVASVGSSVSPDLSREIKDANLDGFSMKDVEIRELESQTEWVDAFPVVKQLRADLDEEQYFEYLDQMTASGYRLFGLFGDDQLAAVAGADITTNMYYGRHLWVFELVTDSDHRSKGFGRQLFQYLVEWAEDRGCKKIALSSGLQREDAHRFYEDHLDMDRASYVYTMELD